MQNTTTIKSYRNTKIKYRSEEWREKRHSMGIGGSEAAAITGMYPYRSALSVYYDKTNDEIKPEVQNEAMRQGADLEDYVAKRFCEATGKKVKKFEYMLQSKEHPIMLADVDRFVVGENAILECKVSQNYQKYSYEDADNIPAYQLIQCLHYMAVTGADKAYLATLVYGKDFYVVEIPREKYEADITALIEMEELFWNDNVLAKVPPAADGSESSTEAIKEQFSFASDDLEEIDLSGIIPQLKELAAVKERIKDEEAKQRELENAIKQHIGEAPAGKCEGFKVTWKNRESTRLDSKALKADLPDIYAKYAKTSTTRTFLFSEVQE